MCHKVLNKEAYEAERKLTIAYEQLAKAHSNLMITHMDYPDATLEYSREMSNYWFDCAEENFREAFKVNSVHVARYSENPNLYKVAIGAILEATKYDALGLLAKRICKILSIEPDNTIDAYKAWQMSDD